VKSPRPKFRSTTTTACSSAEYKWPPSIGERLDVDRISARLPRRDRSRASASTARKVLQVKKPSSATTAASSGETDEIYEIADQVAELTDKEWRVVKIEETAYFVKAAKPRIKGPGRIHRARRRHYGVTHDHPPSSSSAPSATTRST
jgi:hypothetical protein